VLWDRIASDPDKAALARALIGRVPLLGWGETALSAASEAAFGDATKWRRIFPGGSRDAIWFISEISDASMTFPFSDSPAPSMSTVIITRLEQNGHLKSFVRKVMLFDIMRPVQAFSRMQRTSRAMFACLGSGIPLAGRSQRLFESTMRPCAGPLAVRVNRPSTHLLHKGGSSDKS
jgi:hypothetical protein